MIFSVNVLYDRFSLQKYYKMLYILRLGGTFSLFCPSGGEVISYSTSSGVRFMTSG